MAVEPSGLWPSFTGEEDVDSLLTGEMSLLLWWFTAAGLEGGGDLTGICQEGIFGADGDGGNCLRFKRSPFKELISDLSSLIFWDSRIQLVDVVDVKGQVRMEVQGEEEKREDEEDEEDEDVSHVDEEDCLGVQREDRRGGDGQINEQVEKLRRPEGASNESERD